MVNTGNTCFSWGCIVGFCRLVSWISRPITSNIMTPWTSLLGWEWKIQMAGAPHLRWFLVITKKLDAMLENSPFLWWEIMLFPLNCSYCLQMHTFTLYQLFWVDLSFELILFSGHDSRDEGFLREKVFSVWLHNVFVLRFSGEVESMWICAACALDRHHSLFTKDINKRRSSSRWWRRWCINDLWPSPFTWLCVCLTLSARVMTVASAVTSLLSDALIGVKYENK